MLQIQMINFTSLYSAQLMDENHRVSCGLVHNFDSFPQGKTLPSCGILSESVCMNMNSFLF